MNPLKTHRKQLLNKLISSFFSKKELKNFNNIVSTELSSFKSFGSQVSAKNKKQITLDVDNEAGLQSKIELLLTYARQMLNARKYTELLNKLGEFMKTLGEFDLAIMIFESIISYSKNNEETPDFAIAGAYYNLGELYRRKPNWNISFNYIDKAKDIYKAYNDISGLSKCYNILGTVYCELGDFIMAKQNFESSLKLLAKSSDLEEIGKTEINLGITNDITGDHEKAMSYYRNALVKFTKTGDYKRIAEIYHNLGMLNLGRDNLKQAIHDFDNSINFCMKINYLPIMGISYLGKANSLVKKNDLKLAEQFADKAAVLFNKTKDRLSGADVYKVKGIIFREKKKYDKAEFFFNTSLRLNIEMGNKLNEAETNVEMGILFKKTGKTKESNKKLNQALEYYKSINAKTKISEVAELAA